MGPAECGPFFLRAETSLPSELDDDLAIMRVAGKSEQRSSASAAAPDGVPCRVAPGCTGLHRGIERMVPGTERVGRRSRRNGSAVLTGLGATEGRS